MRIIVLHNSVPERAGRDDLDTLAQARAVRQALAEQGHEAQTLALDDLEGAAQALGRAAPDAVFNLVESVQGRSQGIHLVPAMLASLGLACTGAGEQAMRLSTDKLAAKEILARAGLPTPAWLTTAQLDRGPAPAGALPDGALPDGEYIVKSVWEHASHGLDNSSVAPGPRLAEVLALRAATLGGQWFAEAYVPGREFNLALLEEAGGPRPLPLAEIVFDALPPGRRPIVDWEAKWDEASEAYAQTPRRFDFPASDAALLARLARTALDCWRAFGLAGYARVDFRVDQAGTPWIIDVNANPCLAPEAGFAAALGREGTDFARAVEAIVLAATGRHGRPGAALARRGG